MLFQKNKALKRPFKPPTSDSNSINANNLKQVTKVSQEVPPIENIHAQKQYFKIYFSKDVKKKHKVFDDGILIVCTNSCQIFSSEGSKIYDSLKPKNIQSFIENDEPITLGFAYYSLPLKPNFCY